MLFQCWATVFDVGPTLKQHWVNAPCLLGAYTRDTRTPSCTIFHFFTPLLLGCHGVRGFCQLPGLTFEMSCVIWELEHSADPHVRCSLAWPLCEGSIFCGVFVLTYVAHVVQAIQPANVKFTIFPWHSKICQLSTHFRIHSRVGCEYFTD